MATVALTLRSKLLLLLIVTLSLLGRQALTAINLYGLGKPLAYGMGAALLLTSWLFLPGSSKFKFLLLILATIVLSKLLVAEELLHLVLFGLLGVFFARDFAGKPRVGVVLGAAICVGDELLQWALPYRVGDLKDVLLNLAAFLSGTVLSVPDKSSSRL